MCVPVLAVATALLGCDSMRQAHREKTDEPIWDSPDTIKDEKPLVPKGFFKPNRLSGAWSDEGRAIERDMGVY
jgi:hypothetical protein